jgi:hypothetical protein
MSMRKPGNSDYPFPMQPKWFLDSDIVLLLHKMIFVLTI